MTDLLDITPPTTWPTIRTVGLEGLLISFGDALSEPANRAALAFRSAIDAQAWDGVEETSTSLVSTFVRFAPKHLSHAALSEKLQELLNSADWYTAALPSGRRFFRVPTVYGTELAPQLEEAAQVAGLSVEDAVRTLSEARVRVQTIGFAPGQPYLGSLPDCWDIPRQQGLTPQVPEGALVVAIRQFVLFSVSTPTGWRHVGQTGFRLFRPEAKEPFVLRPGDEAQFYEISPEQYQHAKNDPNGGAEWETVV